jgi:N-acetylneuraminic acid mutarotase
MSILDPRFYKYSKLQNQWVEIAHTTSSIYHSTAFFTINNKGYFGTGKSGNKYPPYSDFWQYDFDRDQWQQKSTFGGAGRYGAVGFSIGKKGYIVTGCAVDFNQSDLWEYDTDSNTWSKKKDFPGDGRIYAVGFSINGKGYVATGKGTTSGFMNDVWEYDPVENDWYPKNNFNGKARHSAACFTIGNRAFIGTGSSQNDGLLYDLWEYISSNDSWIKRLDLPAKARYGSVGFSSIDKGYISSGCDGTNVFMDLWEYTPITVVDVEEKNIFNHQFFISPNPASENISISFANSELSNSSISIFNSLGIEMKRFEKKELTEKNSINISTESFPCGIYYCSFNSGINRITKSFVVVR